VRFSAWIFGDTVIRARVGDRIKFSTTNRSDEPAPGIQLTAAPTIHSMDFHSAMGRRLRHEAGSGPLRRSTSNHPGEPTLLLALPKVEVEHHGNGADEKPT
jgi:hypothetical protein